MSKERADFWSKVPPWARPPALPDVVEHERARLLWTLFSTLLVLLVPLAVVGVTFGPNRGIALVIYASVGAFSLACLRLIQRGRVRAAGLTYVVAHWILLFTLTLFLGGISQSHASGMIVITMLGGLTLGTRAGIGTAVISVIAIVALALVERAGYLPPSPVPLGLLEDASSLVANVLLAAVFVSLSVRGLTLAAQREKTAASLYRELADQRAALGSLGQFAVTAPSAEHLAEEAAVILEKALGAKAVLLVQLDHTSSRVLAARGMSAPSADQSTDLRARITEAALLEAGLSEPFPKGPVALAPIPGRQGPRGAVAVVLQGSAPVGTVAFVETVGALVGSALERDEGQRQLRQAQKMEIVGRLAGGVAHDFNNLLTAIGGSAAILADDLPHDENGELARDIVTATERAALLTRQLLAFSRKQVLKPELIHLGRLLHEFRPVLQRLLRADVRIEVDASKTDTTVLADRSSLEQVLLNLAVNARDAMPAGGRLILSTRSTGGEDDPTATGWAVLSVRDTGHGMSKATLEHVFEPFFTTKTDGTGLGLATVLDIVKRSNGRVEVHSEEGVGTTFDVFFPAQRNLPEEVDTSSTRPSPRGTELLLVVDDEPAVRATTRRVLERAGYQVLEAATAVEALSLVHSNQGIALILSDVVMPVRGGMELAADLAKLGKRVLLLSGYAEAVTSSEVPWPFLAKPFASLDLLTKVRETLDGG